MPDNKETMFISNIDVGTTSADLKLGVAQDLVPTDGGTVDLGSASKPWSTIYVNKVHSNNISYLETAVSMLQNRVWDLENKIDEMKNGGQNA